MSLPGNEPLERCRRRDCDRARAPDSDWCPEHEAAERERVRLAKQASRKRKRKAKTCLWCPHKAVPGRPLCAVCQIRAGRVPHRVVTGIVTRHGDLHTKAITEGDGRTRNRFVGRGRRGRVKDEDLRNDDMDLNDAKRCIDQALDRLAAVRAPEVAELPRIQRIDAKLAAIAPVGHAIRFLDAVLERHHEPPVERFASDDETDR